jgi:hypothetical protein
MNRFAVDCGVLLLVAPDAIPAFTIPGTGSMSPADPMMPWKPASERMLALPSQKDAVPP